MRRKIEHQKIAINKAEKKILNSEESALSSENTRESFGGSTVKN